MAARCASRRAPATESATALIAPPDRHLLINPDATVCSPRPSSSISCGPSADLPLGWAAGSYGVRVITAVLSGSGSDGAAGVRAVKDIGGVVIAQDKATAEFFGLPEAAIKTGKVDFVLPLEDIARRCWP